MTFINNNQKQYDLPAWYPVAPLPVSSNTGSATCASDDGSDKSVYYLSGQAFFKYCTISNGWVQLASLPSVPVTSVALKYSKFGGYRGNCLGATSNTITLAPANPRAIVGKNIRIMSGKGAGQERTIISGGEMNTLDKGLITAVAINYITDSTKNWNINQFVGAQVRFLQNTGQTTIRKVLYNDATTLYFSDTNYNPIDPWQNSPLYTSTPYTIPVITAGAQAHFVIENSTATIDEPWDVIPDFTSSFCIITGGVYAITSSASAPFNTFYYYDALSDTWTSKTSMGGHILAALAGDWSLERAGEVSGAFDVGTATSATSIALTNSAKSMPVDRFVNYQLRITGGTGAGQRMRIIANNSDTFTVEKPFKVTPDSTSTYSIFGNTNVIYFSGNNSAYLPQYLIEEDIWSHSQTYASGIAKNGAVSFGGQEGFGITSITRNTGGITAINPIPTVAGANYSIGDILTVTTGGTLGKAKVTGITSTGSVTQVILYSCGLNYTTGASKVTSGGTGTGCTLEIASVGVVGRVVTAMNHNLTIGDDFECSGATEALWNKTSEVLGCDNLTAFDIATTATANWVASNVQGSTLLVDSAASWVINEHAGRIVSVYTAGVNPTGQMRRIVSNTATTMTLNAATTIVNGTARYVVSEPYAHGRAVQFPAKGRGGIGYATSGSTSSLTDSNKSWIPGQWNGYKFRIQSGVGSSNEITIIGNTSDTLTFAAQTFTPDTTTKYLIMDSFGTCTGAGTTSSLVDASKKWTVNQWAGKACRIISGSGTGTYYKVLSNTANTLTFSGAGSIALDATTSYCILESQDRGVGSGLSWIFANTDTSNLTQGKYLGCFFGGATNVFGRYDITKELWEITQTTSPQGDYFAIGSSFAYSGKDRIYYQLNSTGRFGYLDVNTLLISAGTQLYQAPLGTAVSGSRMEVVTTDQGTDIIYLLDNAGFRMWRTLILY